ncbi:MAG: hypothetical protein KIT09_27705 [Bryobacteraceae bacterium]|nr:hypothetical protein [Bryobacteraceae bacterium]
MANDSYTEQLLTNLLGDALTRITKSGWKQETLDGLIPTLRGGATVVSGGDDGAMTQLARQLAELTLASRTQAEYIEANTKAVIENSVAKASGSTASTAGNIGRTILSFLGGGFGLPQLIGKLFGGREEAAPAALPSYSLPSPVQVSAAVSSSGLQPIRYASDGLPRAVEAAPAAASTPITIQVQAIDSRSFRDHSSEIAAAVREALLHSHSLSDVVLEL